MNQVQHVTLRDGRSVAVHRLADGGNRTVVLSHAAPGSGAFDPDPGATARHAITLLAPDRPGYGESAPLPASSWASVSAAADDLAEVIEQLGTGPVGVAGWSAGGRVALALAARHPELVDRVAIIATPAPDQAVPWIGPEEKAGIEAMRGMPADAVNEGFGAQMAGLAAMDPGSDEGLALVGGSPEDDEITGSNEGVRERLTGMLRAAFAQGAGGMASEIAGYTLQPWGFEPPEVATMTLLIYGEADPIAGPDHGRWWHNSSLTRSSRSWPVAATS